jgi:hypothetical protein
MIIVAIMREERLEKVIYRLLPRNIMLLTAILILRSAISVNSQ